MTRINIHRMQMLQLNRQTYSQIFLHNFTCTTNTYTYRIITAGTVGVLTSARHGLVKQAASVPYGWFYPGSRSVSWGFLGSVEDVMQLTTSDSIQSRTWSRGRWFVRSMTRHVLCILTQRA